MTRPVAIVTGAAQGLGASIAATLLDRGHRVVVADVSPTVESLFADDVADECAVTLQVDLAEPAAGRVLVAAAHDAFGRCDAIVNNAGVGGPHRAIADLTDDELLGVLAVNLLGAFRLCRAALPSLRESGSGRIVNVGSVFAERPSMNDGAYSMSKAALGALTRSLAVEEGSNGITANTVAPGYMLTAMHAAEAARLAERAGVTVEQVLGRLRSDVPVGRHGTGVDVAETVAWLLSPGAGYISGQIIRVDGGLSVS